MERELFFSLVLVIAALLISIGSRRRRKGMPPGSMGLPFIGETPSFVKPHHVLVPGDFMANRISRYGKVFTTHLLGRKTIVSTDPTLNVFILKNESKFGPGWPQGIAKIMGRNALSMKTGDEHRKSKANILEFLTIQKVRTVFLHQVEESAKMVFRSWDDGSIVLLQQEANSFAFTTMAKQLLSISPEEAEMEKLEREYESFKKGLFSFPINFPGTAYSKALRSRSKVLSMIKQKISERMNNGRRITCDQGDYLDWLMEKTDQNEEQIGEKILGLLFAGHDTTRQAITMAVYFLNECPQVLDHLREEHEEIARSRRKEEKSLTWEDYKMMEFTQCVINETLRLGSVPRVVMRRATTDTQFKEHSIPGGCNMIIHLAATHTDPSLFEDSKSFNPWRWMNNSSSSQFSEFIPFGTGIRRCPGAELARLEMSVFLHHLVSNFTWEITEPDEPIVTSFVDFKKGLPIRVRTKNAAES